MTGFFIQDILLRAAIFFPAFKFFNKTFMLKLYHTAISFFSFFFATAQIPAGYYTTAGGLTCATLKTALFNKISTGTNAVTNSEVLVKFTSTDVHKNDANTKDIIWDIY